MEDRLLFQDHRFALEFSYPKVATDGEPVDREEIQQEGMLRFHILSPKSREVYFEVSRYDSTSAQAEYRQHRAGLHKQFERVEISELKGTLCASLPGYEYSIEWDQGFRRVLLVERGDVTYRIIYNPRFPINMQILTTLRWLNDP